MQHLQLPHLPRITPPEHLIILISPNTSHTIRHPARLFQRAEYKVCERKVGVGLLEGVQDLGGGVPAGEAGGDVGSQWGGDGLGGGEGGPGAR